MWHPQWPAQCNSASVLLAVVLYGINTAILGRRIPTATLSDERNAYNHDSSANANANPYPKARKKLEALNNNGHGDGDKFHESLLRQRSPISMCMTRRQVKLSLGLSDPDSG